MLREFFSYVPSSPPPEEPAEERPDPNKDRALSEPFRAARKTLVATCAVGIAWATAQFSVNEIRFDSIGITVALENVSISALLGAAVLYLTARMMIEFAMMSRHVRRWPLARLDFRAVLFLARFAILALAAGALQRSLWSVVVAVIGSIVTVAVVAFILTGTLMFFTTPVRIWARRRANADSAANATIEGFVWAGAFAVGLTMAGSVLFAFASLFEPLSGWVWTVPPDPITFGAFMLVLNVTFLSHWLLRPVMSRLFAERPGYRTSRNAEGRLIFTLGVEEEREPLL